MADKLKRPSYGTQHSGFVYLAGDPNNKNSWMRQEEFRALQEQYDPTKGMSGTEKVLAGIGSGMVDAARRGTNLVLPKSLQPSWAKTDAIERQMQLDESLSNTGHGLVGQIVGGAAATAPVGGLAAGGARAVGTALQASQRGGRGAQVLGRTLGSRPGAITAQGAAEGAILGNTGDGGWGSGAALGAGGGLALHGAGRVGRSALSRSAKKREAGKGLVGTSSAAKRIQGQITPDDLGNPLPPITDVGFVPASHAPDEGIWKQIYSGLVANLPISSTMIRGQHKRAVGTWREKTLENAVPVGHPVGTIVDAGDSIQGSIGRMQDAWAGAFDPVKEMVYQLPDTFRLAPSILKRLKSEHGALLKIPKGGEVVDGHKLMALRNAMRKLQFGEGDPSPLQKARLGKAMDRIDNVIKDNLDPNGLVASGRKRLPQGPQVLRDYQENLQRYKLWKTIEDAARTQTGTSQFTPEALASTASRRAGASGLAGRGGILQESGNAAAEVLKPFPSNPGIFQMVAALGLMGGVYGGATSENQGFLGKTMDTLKGAVAGPVGAAAIGVLMTIPAVQQRLMGKGRDPRKTAVILQKFLDKKGVKDMTRADALAFAGRQTTVAALLKELDGED